MGETRDTVCFFKNPSKWIDHFSLNDFKIICLLFLSFFLINQLNPNVQCKETCLFESVSVKVR